MKYMLLKNVGNSYFQLDSCNLSDYVNSFSKFLSVSTDEFMNKIELPAKMKYVSNGLYDLFDIDVENTVDADRIKDEFSKRFRELAHQNNSGMPFTYKILSFFSKDYSRKLADKKLDYLATLHFWPKETIVFSRIHK